MTSKTHHLFFRAPEASDWPAILEIANQSVAGVPGAGSQDQWLENRRRFAESGGVQRHFVAESSQSAEVLGYAALESDPKAPRAFRVFVVVASPNLPTVGSRLYDHALTQLHDLRAQRVWFTEYAEDAALVEFAHVRGFREVRRFPWRGVDLVVLERELGNAAAQPLSGPG